MRHFEYNLSKKTIQRPWLPAHKPFESGRVGKRWEGYNTTRWRTVSILFKSLNPVCCVVGCGQPTYYTDHIVPVLQLVHLGRDPYDVYNECQPLCRLHGDQKTGHEGSNERGRGVKKST